MSASPFAVCIKGISNCIDEAVFRVYLDAAKATGVPLEQRKLAQARGGAFILPQEDDYLFGFGVLHVLAPEHVTTVQGMIVA